MQSLKKLAPSWMTVAVVVLCVLIAAVNARWVMLYRAGGGLDIDEAGYISYAILLERALQGGGISGWFHVFSYPYGQAPFTMASASWLMAATGNASEWTAMLINSLINGLLLLAVYALGSRAYGRGVGAVAALLAGTMPYIFDHARNFNFATSAALFLTATIYCYERSDGMRRPAWALMLGICAGLMLLSRTMVLAFLPALAVTFLVASLVSRTPVPRLLATLALSLAAFLLVCGPWYFINGETVFGYLFSFGYGQHAAAYANADGTFTLNNIIQRVDNVIYYMKTVHAVIVGAGILILVISVLLQGVVRDGRLTFGAQMLLLVGLGFLALLSSRNVGFGFVIPLLPPLIIAIVGAGASLLPSRALQIAAACVLLVSTGAVFALNADRRLCEAAVAADGPTGLLGDEAVHCGSTIGLYIQNTRPTPFMTDEELQLGRRWRALSNELAGKLAALPGSDHGVMLASRHFLLNANTVNLDLMKSRGAFMSLQQIDPVTLGSAPEDYKQWLQTPPVGGVCYIVSANTAESEFSPAADPDNLRKALSELGYTEIERLPTPNSGQYLSIFRNPAATCQPAG